MTEREQIVAWLWDEWNGLHNTTSDSGRSPDRKDRETLIRMAEITRIRDAIERGDHLPAQGTQP